MKKQLAFVISLALASAARGASISPQAKAAVLSGTWSFSVVMLNRTKMREYNIAYVFTLKQQGRKLVGACTGPDGEKKVTGTVTGNKVTFAHDVIGDGGRIMNASYTGTIESPAKMTGVIEHVGDPDGIRPGKWTATKK